MPDTNEAEPSTDLDMPLVDIRVCVDDFGPFDAKVASTDLGGQPRFTLDTVRKIADRTQKLADEYGSDEDTIHVFDSGTGGKGERHTVVLHVRWAHFEDDAPQDAAEIVQPDDDGLYRIGEEWAWDFASWRCACGRTMAWPVTDCEGCDLTRSTQPEETASAQTSHTSKQPDMPKTDPQWLAEAEAAYVRSQEAAAARKAHAALDQADRINETLAELGITPIVPALVLAERTVVTPAVLVDEDPEEELYSVHAEWDETEGKVRLSLGHYWGEYAGRLPGRLLATVADVVVARREGPALQPEPKQATEMSRKELRRVAEQAAQYSSAATPAELTAMVGGLAAAILYLADTVTRNNDRP
ncbi:hypothetical protein [Streptomyces sp. NPDC002172]